VDSRGDRKQAPAGSRSGGSDRRQRDRGRTGQNRDDPHEESLPDADEALHSSLELRWLVWYSAPSRPSSSTPKKAKRTLLVGLIPSAENWCAIISRQL
jgi:hypothetical protein